MTLDPDFMGYGMIDVLGKRLHVNESDDWLQVSRTLKVLNYCLRESSEQVLT